MSDEDRDQLRRLANYLLAPPLFILTVAGAFLLFVELVRLVQFGVYFQLNKSVHLGTDPDNGFFQAISLAWAQFKADGTASGRIAALLAFPFALLITAKWFPKIFRNMLSALLAVSPPQSAKASGRKPSDLVDDGPDDWPYPFPRPSEMPKPFEAWTARGPNPKALESANSLYGKDPKLIEAILASVRTEIVLKRKFPRNFDHANLSYFGGLPTAGPDFEWPTMQVTDELSVPLRFLVQIDLATLPDAGLREPLPSTGRLYFFTAFFRLPDDLTIAPKFRGAKPTYVKYDNAPVGSLRTIFPPKRLPGRDDGGGKVEMRSVLEAVYTELELGTTFTRWDITPIQRIHSEIHGELLPPPAEVDVWIASQADANVARSQLEEVLKGFDEKKKIEVEAPELRPVPGFDPNAEFLRPGPGFPFIWLTVEQMATQVLGLIDRADHGLRHRIKQLDDKKQASVGDWPVLPQTVATWEENIANSPAHIAKLEADLGSAQGPANDSLERQLCDAKARVENFQAQIDKHRLGEEIICQSQIVGPEFRSVFVDLIEKNRRLRFKARALCEQAEHFGHLSVMSNEQRTEFWTAWSDLLSGPDKLYGKSARGEPIPKRQADEYTLRALIETTEGCLSQSAELAALVPAEFVDFVRPRHLPNLEHPHMGHGHHHMFGYPEGPQGHSWEMDHSHLTLLHLAHDNGLGWDWGGSTTMNYMVVPSDLANMRLDRVEAGMEAD